VGRGTHENMGNFLAALVEPRRRSTFDELDYEYDKIFVPQEHNWDCGLSCCGMVCKWLNRHDLYEHLLKDDISMLKTPLWTIDIYCFLRMQGINARMQTLCIGIEPKLFELSWYQKHIENDVSRVNSKFALADTSGWVIEKSTTPIENLKEFFEKGATAAIALVDNITLQRGEESLTSTNSLDAAKSASNYSGHFIFLVRYNSLTDDFLYLDPARGSGIRFVSSSHLTSARAVEGTDFDIIVVFQN